MDPVAWEYITYKEQAACDSCTKISETLPLFLATPIGVAAVSIGTRFVKNRTDRKKTSFYLFLKNPPERITDDLSSSLIQPF
jgi:hypothetical protein